MTTANQHRDADDAATIARIRDSAAVLAAMPRSADRERRYEAWFLWLDATLASSPRVEDAVLVLEDENNSRFDPSFWSLVARHMCL